MHESKQGNYDERAIASQGAVRKVVYDILEARGEIPDLIITNPELTLHYDDKSRVGLSGNLVSFINSLYGSRKVSVHRIHISFMYTQLGELPTQFFDNQRPFAVSIENKPEEIIGIEREQKEQGFTALYYPEEEVFYSSGVGLSPYMKPMRYSLSKFPPQNWMKIQRGGSRVSFKGREYISVRMMPPITGVLDPDILFSVVSELEKVTNIDKEAPQNPKLEYAISKV